MGISAPQTRKSCLKIQEKKVPWLYALHFANFVLLFCLSPCQWRCPVTTWCASTRHSRRPRLSSTWNPPASASTQSATRVSASLLTSGVIVIVAVVQSTATLLACLVQRLSRVYNVRTNGVSVCSGGRDDGDGGGGVHRVRPRGGRCLPHSLGV